MSFVDLSYILLFPLIILGYNLVPKRGRLYFLLSTSYLIYGSMDTIYLLLLFATSMVTYGFSRWIDYEQEDTRKHRIMFLGIACVVAPLVFFKYVNTHRSWILPVGISYYTFMSISYLVDLYNEEVEAEKNPCSVALFLSFFPIVFSGPIERAGHLFPQFSKMNRSTVDDLSAGAKTMLWGYFMKFCVADRLLVYMSAALDGAEYRSGATLAFEALLEPLQAYGDLGGYTLLALGSARCLGFHIVPNFRQPFYATSLSDLWRRWHMSLINWLLDYIYTPASFYLRSWRKWGIAAALLLTMFFSAIWHGTSVPYIFWGLGQALWIGMEALTQNQRTLWENKHNLRSKWWYTLPCRIFVFSLFAAFIMVGSRSDYAELQLYLTKIFTQFNQGSFFFDLNTFIHAGIALAILYLYDHCKEHQKPMPLFESKYRLVRILAYAAMICFILCGGVLNNNSFIYYRF